MEISDNLACLFTAQIQDHEDTYQIQVPTQEIELGKIEPEGTYRVAVMPTETQTEHTTANDTVSDSADTAGPSQSRSQRANQEPPVDVGETRTVEIDSIGDQGDGIARVDRGYVLIIPDTEVGDSVTVRIENTTENVAFAEVVDRHQRPQHD